MAVERHRELALAERLRHRRLLRRVHRHRHVPHRVAALGRGGRHRKVVCRRVTHQVGQLELVAVEHHRELTVAEGL